MFATTSFGAASAPPTKPVSSPREQRHILPKDLPSAIQHLDDEDLERLLAVTLAEAKRRRKNRQANPSDESAPEGSSPRDKSCRRRKAEAATVSLTLGKLNAVRAAFKAGVTLSQIARQFGISQSDVRKALADRSAS